MLFVDKCTLGKSIKIYIKTLHTWEAEDEKVSLKL